MSLSLLKKIPIDVPLVVDLDGSLLDGDGSHLTVAHYLVSSPTAVIRCLLWLLKGRNYLRCQAVANYQIDHSKLKLRHQVVDIIQQEKKSGRKLILATGSPEPLGVRINQEYFFFDYVLGSRVDYHCVGKRKLGALRSLIKDSEFIYIGDSHNDLAIWADAPYAILVNPSQSLEEKAQKCSEVLGIIK